MEEVNHTDTLATCVILATSAFVCHIIVATMIASASISTCTSVHLSEVVHEITLWILSILLVNELLDVSLALSALTFTLRGTSLTLTFIWASKLC